MSKCVTYFRSRSTRLGLVMGGVMYFAYAPNSHYTNGYLIGVTTFVAFALPFYSKLSNKVEEKVHFVTAMVTAGRLARFGFQVPFNLAIFTLLIDGGVIAPPNLLLLGGPLGLTLLTTAVSQGAQYLALCLANREIGDKNRSVILGLSANIVFTALASTLNVPLFKVIFVVASVCFGSLVLGVGVLSDLRALFPKRGGIGIFLGTFNPFHNTHLKIIKDAMARRGLRKVYIHCTVIPRLHADALRKGEITIGHRTQGMRVYEKTGHADVHVNYFPTGNAFFEYETRRALIALAIDESQLIDNVTVLSEPELYTNEGFHGIISVVKKLHPGVAIHGIHGSDLGGMWIRSIYDECGWIYPYPVRRVDGVSSTAVRKGATGMLPAVVEQILGYLREGKGVFHIAKWRFENLHGVIQYEAI